MRSDLERLLALLKASDLQAMDSYAQLKQTHETHLNAALHTLDEAMSAVDYSQAAQHCKSLMREFANEPPLIPELSMPERP